MKGDEALDSKQYVLQMKMPTNYYYNLLGALFLADINNSNKQCRIYYIDHTVLIVDKSDEYNYIGKNLILGNNCNFTKYPDFSSEDSTKTIMYNPYCMYMDISYSTVKNLLIDSGILEMSVRKNYDIIAKRITVIESCAQEELLKYLEDYRDRYLEEDNTIDFGDLYQEMIVMGANPLSSIFYDRISNQDSEYLIGNMNSIYRFYILNNILLSMIYLDTVYKFMFNDRKHPIYNEIFKELGAYCKASFDVDNNNTPFFSNTVSKVLYAIKDHVSISRALDTINGNRDKSMYIDTVYTGQRFVQNVSNILTDTRDSNETPFSATNSTVMFMDTKEYFLSNSLYNLVNFGSYINSITYLMKGNDDVNSKNRYQYYYLYLPDIYASICNVNDIKEKHLSSDSILNILINNGRYEYMVNHADNKYRHRSHRYSTLGSISEYTYGDLVLYPSIDPTSNTMVDINGLGMFPKDVDDVIYESNEDAKASIVRSGVLGSSVFSGHIQSYGNSTMIYDRHQYIAPIWIRPLYERELFNKYGMFTHVINKHCIPYSAGNYQFGLISSSVSTTNLYPWIVSRGRINTYSMIPRYRYDMYYDSNVSIRDTISVVKCSMATMILVRAYMIGVIHMIVSDGTFKYMVDKPTKSSEKLLKRDFRIIRRKCRNHVYDDLNNISTCSVPMFDYDEGLNGSIYRHAFFVPFISGNDSSIKRHLHCAHLANQNELAKMINKIPNNRVKVTAMFDMINEIYIYDSLRITPNMAQMLCNITKRDLSSYVQV